MYLHKLPVWSPVWQPIKILRYRCCRHSSSFSWHFISMYLLILSESEASVTFMWQGQKWLSKYLEEFHESLRIFTWTQKRFSLPCTRQLNALIWLTALCDKLVWTYTHCHWIMYTCYILLVNLTSMFLCILFSVSVLKWHKIPLRSGMYILYGTTRVSESHICNCVHEQLSSKARNHSTTTKPCSVIKM